MKRTLGTVRLGGAVLGAAGIAALSYAGYAATTWARYGRRDAPHSPDPLLDRFMPDYEVAERHELRVRAPAEIVYSAACNLDLTSSPVVRALFAGRSLIMGAKGSRSEPPGPLLQYMQALGWGLLSEVAGRKAVFGAFTQPWRAEVALHRVPPDEFAAFAHPGYAKIVWTIEAEPAAGDGSIARTETRVTTTDPESRERFRRYWAAFSPGILLIRRQLLRAIRREAERAWMARRVPATI
ncbi:MAG TPA: hypothetical protein VFM14_08065 [Gemmatimonadales bacterium]|nr:hypothetical protein [Gemmatimonadales bacterium]